MKRPSKASKKADKKAKPKTGEKRDDSPLQPLATTSSYAYPFIVCNQTALPILRPEVGESPLPVIETENAVGRLEKSLIETGRKKDAHTTYY